MQKQYPVTHTEAEWRKILTPEQYAIMREHGTEMPGSCALLHEKRAGARRRCPSWCDAPWRPSSAPRMIAISCRSWRSDEVGAGTPRAKEIVPTGPV